MTSIHQRYLITAIAVGLSTSGITAAQAQAPTPMQEHGKVLRAQMTPEKFVEHIKRREAKLHDALQLTAQQEAAWKIFTDQTRPSEPMAWRQHDELEKLPAPERMEKMLARMRNSERQLTQRLAATKTFYAVLTPTQRTTFDQQFSHHRHDAHHGEREAPPNEQK